MAAGRRGRLALGLCARAGLDVAILDRSVFPRDKVCGGWITPAVIEELRIDLDEYRRGRVLQPIAGFLTSRIGGTEVVTDYGRPISYGIRRCEFDTFLLERCGARDFSGRAIQVHRAERRFLAGEFADQGAIDCWRCGAFLSRGALAWSGGAK